MCNHVGLGVQVTVSEDGSVQFKRCLSRRGIGLVRKNEDIFGVCPVVNVLGDFKGNRSFWLHNKDRLYRIYHNHNHMI
jgi:hypothetical protein